MSTPETVQANFDARSHAAAELQGLYTEAAGRELSVDERSKEEKLGAAIEQFDSRISEGLESMKADKAAGEARAEFDAAVAPVAAPAPAEARSDVERFAAGEIRSIHFAPEARDMKVGTTAGNTVATGMYSQIVKHLEEVSTAVKAGATVLNTSNGESITVPTSLAYSTAVRLDEGQGLTESDNTFASVTLNAYKYGLYTQATKELLEDSSFNIEAYIAERSGVAIAEATGADFVAGDGSDDPNGLINGSTTSDLAAAGVVTFDDLIDAQHAIVSKYRPGAAWIMADSTIASVRKLQDSNDQYIWQPAVVAGEPDRILGAPVFTDPAVEALGTDNNSVAVYGDIAKGYIVRVAGGVSIERSDEVGFLNDLVTWKITTRVDGEIVDNGAFVVVTDIA